MQNTPPWIVGIGASAGGLRALVTFFEHLPARTGCAFVVVQHLAPDGGSLLDELLAPRTPMPVRRAETGTVPAADTVHIIPPNRRLTLEGGQLLLAERRPPHGSEHLIDLFLESLAADAGPRAIAVILSGNGTDGTAGAAAVHRAGGLVFAQTPATAESPAMPESVIAGGTADQILPPAEIAAALLAQTALPPAAARDRSGYLPIFALLRQEIGIDFGHYKPPTIERRVARRMLTRRSATLADYAALLGRDEAELRQLANDLLIGVTEFFRDPAAFALLGSAVLGPFLREAGRRELRVWVVGCSTGEEVYSLAMLINEQALACSFGGQVSLFATDVHRDALHEAATGIYSSDRLEGVSPERLQRYFSREGEDRFRIVPEIRQRIVFAPHSIANDPPFTRMDLISCRNLLIYFDQPLQDRVTATFHYALRAGGALFLGSSENLGPVEGDFTVIDAKQKLYRLRTASQLPGRIPPVPALRAALTAGAPLPLAAPPIVSPERQLLRAYDQLFARHLPPGVIVTETFAVLHYLGVVARFLLPSAGRATDHLLERADGDLRLALAAIVPRALASATPVLLRGIRGGAGSAAFTVDLLAASLRDDAPLPPLVHVSFVAAAGDPPAPAPAPATPEAFSAAASLHERNLHLEFEIVKLPRHLQAAVEELQAANAELRSTNEELISSNEELQSTNEELHSVNAGLARKTEELQRAADDLGNLLASTDVGTVFLDRELRIRNFNPAIVRVFNLIAGDLGRPLDHIACQLDDQTAMIGRVRTVLESGRALEREVRTRDGRWLLKRILPFYAKDRAVEGIVLTFTDISATKAMQARFDLAVASAHLVWWEWSVVPDAFVFHSTGTGPLDYPAAEAPRTSVAWKSLVHPADLPLAERTLDACLRGLAPDWSCEFRFKIRRGTWLWVAAHGRVTERGSAGQPLVLLGTMHDIDTLKRSGEALARDATFLSHVEDAIVSFDPQGFPTYWNKGAELIFGWKPEEVVGRPLPVPPSAEGTVDVAAIVADALHGGNFAGELEWPRRDGSGVWVDARFYAMRNEHDVISGCMLVARDITQRRGAALHQANLERQLQQSRKMETLGTLAGGIAHDFNNLLLVILGYTQAITEMVPAGDPVHAKLDHVRRAGQRASALVQRILTFSRKREEPRQPVVLAQLVVDSLPLLRASLYPTIEIRTNFATGRRQVLAEPTQLHQVLLNLYANAGQAMRQKHGRLTIEVLPLEIVTPPAVVVGSVAPGSYLSISVADNGAGMTPESAARAFEPFFTTKRVSDGTGLGLSIVHGIITGHGGAVTLTTRPGEGTVITILLPEHLGAPAPAPAPPVAPRHGRGERVVVIDDEESVAAITQHALEQRGFHALAFTQAVDFLEHLAAHPGETDIVVADQAMPTMTGSALAAHLRQHGHRMPVLIISGYARSLTAARLRKRSPRGLSRQTLHVRRARARRGAPHRPRRRRQSMK